MPFRVAFCHPDLGIGGAERLVVDAAVGLQSLGHDVTIYTTHHDPSRCFSETVDGTLPPVRVHGDWIPRHVLGKGHAIFAYLRCMFLAIIICIDNWRNRELNRYQVVIADQVSAVLPIFYLFAPGIRRLFYCHFPDMLLSQPGGWIKRLYRWPINWFEEISTGFAHVTLVNSGYTQSIFATTFKKLATWMKPEILYPAVELPSDAQLRTSESSWRSDLPEDLTVFLGNPEEVVTFLSINRFERKKGLALSLHALSILYKNKPIQQCKLILAGGYDKRLAENREHLEELRDLARALDLDDRVYFMTSFTDAQKQLLLAMCNAVIYTPENEHFGIVPLEAMAFGKLVIACDSGGPKESVVDGLTGILCAPTQEAFALAMAKVASGDVVVGKDVVRSHIEANFVRGVFGKKLDNILKDMISKEKET